MVWPGQHGWWKKKMGRSPFLEGKRTIDSFLVAKKRPRKREIKTRELLNVSLLLK